MTQLGEITEPKIDQAGPPSSGEFAYVDISSVDNNAKRIVEPKRLPADGAPSRARQRLRSGDVLVSMTRPNLNAVAIVPPELDGAIGSTGFHVLRARESVLPQWLYYGVQTRQFVGAMSELVQGALYPAVRPKDIRAFDIALPALAEQRSIVAEIEKQFSRLDEAVANLKRVKANLKRYRATVLVQAINGTLVELRQDCSVQIETGVNLVRRILDERAQVRSGKSGKGAPVGPGDVSGFPALPATWTWATLDQIGQEGRPVIYGIIKPGPDTPGGVPYVRVTEMKDGYVDVPNLRRAAREREAKFSRARLTAGDLLISKDGTIGRVAVVPPELEGGNITQHVMRAPVHRFMSRDFVVWAIRSEFCQRWLTGETRGVALRGVNVEDFRRLPIPVPPRTEQDRIVAEVDRHLSISREIELEVDASLRRANGLRQALLARHFAGQG